MDSEVRSYRTGAREVVLDRTRDVADSVAGRADGLVHVFVPHATAGLAILETGAGSDDDLLAALGDLLPSAEHVAGPTVARHRYGPGGGHRGCPPRRSAGAVPRGEPSVLRSARLEALPGDELVRADVVMDRAFHLAAPPEAVWPWLVQLGKQRAGWYLPASVERFVPASRRALRRIDPHLLEHRVGDVIPDWGGADATFALAAIEEPRVLLYTSRRGRTDLTWCLFVTPVLDGTRVHLRLRLGPVRRKRLAEVGGGLFDALTIAGLAAGLRERIGDGVDS